MRIHSISLTKKNCDDKIDITPKTARPVNEPLPGELWFVTCYFNPCMYQSRLDNFIEFYSQITSQTPHVFVVELAFKEENLVLHRYVNPVNLYQIVEEDETNLLWHKEALLNIGISKLPDSCDKVGWIDCDILIPNDEWVTETAELLNDYVVVQPYKTVHVLPSGCTKCHDQFATSKMTGAFTNHYEPQNRLSHYGYMCAYRRSLLQKVGGLFDSCVIGAGDLYVGSAVTGATIEESQLYSRAHYEHYETWRKSVSEIVNGSFRPLSVNIYHLYHGTRKNRQYDTRMSIFRACNFNPQTDLFKQDNGLYRLVQKRDLLIPWLQGFFSGRQEDDKASVCSKGGCGK